MKPAALAAFLIRRSRAVQYENGGRVCTCPRRLALFLWFPAASVLPPAAGATGGEDDEGGKNDGN